MKEETFVSWKDFAPFAQEFGSLTTMVARHGKLLNWILTGVGGIILLMLVDVAWIGAHDFSQFEKMEDRSSGNLRIPPDSHLSMPLVGTAVADEPGTYVLHPSGAVSSGDSSQSEVWGSLPHQGRSQPFSNPDSSRQLCGSFGSGMEDTQSRLYPTWPLYWPLEWTGSGVDEQGSSN